MFLYILFLYYGKILSYLHTYRWKTMCRGFWPKRECHSLRPWTCRVSWTEPKQSRVNSNEARMRCVESLHLTAVLKVHICESVSVLRVPSKCRRHCPVCVVTTFTVLLDQYTVESVCVLCFARWSAATRVSCRAWRRDWSSRTVPTAVSRTMFTF